MNWQDKLLSIKEELKNSPSATKIEENEDMDLVGNEFLPYDFISIDPIEANYKAKGQRDLKNNLTGVLTVEMTLKTPMVAIDEFGLVENVKVPNRKVDFLNYEHALQQEYYKKIPASSLRGMLHNAAEIIWNDVLTVDEGGYSSKKQKGKSNKEDPLLDLQKKYLPKEWLKKNINTFCHGLASHLFGFAQNDENQKKKDMNDSLSSLLRFTDAITQDAEYQEAYLKRFTLAQPNGLIDTKKIDLLKKFKGNISEQEHFNWTYMIKENGKLKPAGRKVYLAGTTIDLKEKCIASKVKEPFKDFVRVHPKINEKRQSYFENNKFKDLEKIILIAPGTVYTFKIYFKNLKEEELAALVRLIELNDGAETSKLAKEATYAIGRGKPLGFGRVRLTVKDIFVRDINTILNLSESEYSKPIDKATLYKGENPFQKKFNEYFALTNSHLFDQKKRYKIGKESKVVQYTKIKRG